MCGNVNTRRKKQKPAFLVGNKGGVSRGESGQSDSSLFFFSDSRFINLARAVDGSIRWHPSPKTLLLPDRPHARLLFPLHSHAALHTRSRHPPWRASGRARRRRPPPRKRGPGAAAVPPPSTNGATGGGVPRRPSSAGDNFGVRRTPAPPSATRLSLPGSVDDGLRTVRPRPLHVDDKVC